MHKCMKHNATTTLVLFVIYLAVCYCSDLIKIAFSNIAYVVWYGKYFFKRAS